MSKLDLKKVSDLDNRGALSASDLFLVELSNGQTRKTDFATIVQGVGAIAGSGEANTGSNLGAGARVFESKNGVTLRFRTLVPAAGGKITISEGANTITFNVDENQLQTRADLLSHVVDSNNPHNVSANQVGNAIAQWNASQLQGRAIATTAPTSGQALLWNGTAWAPSTVSGAVSSVNGQTGAVVLNTGAIAEGTNLYYTDARVDARITAANLSATYVTLGTAQTVSGAKTFSTIPVLPTTDPTTANQATRKGYVDSLDAQNVKLSGDQTIAGAKIFSSAPLTSAAQSTAVNSLARRDFVTGLDAENVKLTGAQTVSGAKTFSGIQTFIGDIRIDSDSTRSITFRTAAGVDIFSFERDVTNSRINFFARSTLPAVFTGLAPQSLVAPANAADLTTKSYVDGLDAANVKLTGTQSIGGAKTFTTIPLLPASDPTTANQAARKAYVDTKVGLSGDETIAGVKTFSSNPLSSAIQSTAVNALTRKDYVDGLDAANVKLTGDQSIGGIKTFSSIPVLPTTNPTLADQATRKAYVDGLDGQNVKLTGNQTVGGVKTFSSAPLTSAAQSTATNSLTRKDYVDAHANDTTNPHNVTAAQVGNTTAQWNANQLQGRSVSAATPSDTQALAWDAISNSWAPRSVSALLNQYLNIAENVVSATRNATAADNNKLFRCTNGTIQLPDAASNSGMVVGIARIATAAFVLPASLNTIAGLGEYLHQQDQEVVVLRSNGVSNWEIVGQYIPQLQGIIPVSRGGTGVTSYAALKANLAIPFNSTLVQNSGDVYSLSPTLDDGKVFIAGTGSGSVKYRLPPGSSVPNGYSVTFIKNAAPNTMRVQARSGDSIGDIAGSDNTQVDGTITNCLNVTNKYASVTLINRGSIWYIQSYFINNSVI